MKLGIWTQEVNIPSLGVDARDTDALECLLALCRVMGLGYKIDLYKDKYSATVYWNDLPTDFFDPKVRFGSCAIVNASNPVDALRGCIDMVFCEVCSNGEMFSRLYKDHWEKVGGEW